MIPWLHRLGLLRLRFNNLCSLSLHGDPITLPALRIADILPKTVLPTNFTPYTELSLSYVRVPSLEILLRLLRQFTLVRKYEIVGVVWNERQALHPPQSAGYTRFQPGPLQVYVSAGNGIRRNNPARLCLDICSFYSNFPLHCLPMSDGNLARSLVFANDWVTFSPSLIEALWGEQ